SILNANVTGINISFDNFNAGTDTRKTVRLRGFNLNGANTGTIGIRILGGSTNAGGSVFIEDILIDGNYGGSARGISDERTQGGSLYISNTAVRNVGS